MNKNGTSDPFVQCELCTHDDDGQLELVTFLPAHVRRSRSKACRQRYRKQTRIIKRNNINPQWEEDLSFDIPMSACDRETLESCTLKIDCYSSMHKLGSPHVKHTTPQHLIGTTTVSGHHD
jgi:hypothetical protein